MKLHRIRLRNFRGVVDSEVEFAERGVTIVQGPNEVGKSSIPEALELAIEYPDSSKHSKVLSVKPEDRDEGPEVEIEMSTGPYRLVYEKRWLRRPTTTLRVTAPRNENFTGREAHDALKGILEETLDDDLRLALWIEQGTELKLPSFSIPSMRRALGNAAGEGVTGDDDDVLMGRIRAEYEKYWTRTGRITGDRRAARQGVEEAGSEADALKKRMDDVEKDVTEMVRLVDEAKGIGQTLQELGASEGKLADEWAATDRLRTDLDRVEAIHSTAEARLQQAVQEWNHREESKGELEIRAKELAELVAETELVAPALFAATGQSEEAAANLKAAADALRSAGKRQGFAFGDRDFRQDEIDVKLISERHERYEEASELLKASEEHLASAKVDEKALAEIERAYNEDVRAQAAVESAAATVEAKALSDIALDIDGKKIELATNEAHRILVEDEVEMVVPGVAQFKVSAAPEARVLAEQRHDVHEAYLRLCQNVGVSDLGEARRAEQERRDALRNRDEARKAMKREVRDWTPEFMRSRIASLAANVEAYPKERPDEPPMPVDLDEARSIATEAAGTVAEREREAQSRDEDWKQAQEYLNKVKIEQAELAARVDSARERRDEASDRLSVARESRSDGDLQDARDGVQHGYDASLKSLEEAKVRFKAADPDSIKARLENVGGAKQRFEMQRQTNRRRQDELRGKLEALGEEGIHGTLEEVQGRLEQARREHESFEARAEAAKLLWETFDRHRRQAHQRYVGPFKKQIEELGRIVFRRTFKVELDAEKLEVARRTLNGVTLNMDQLSTGAREQLGVLSRLACAVIVSPDDGGVPVMIDDALGWSDPQRLQSMGAAINAAGKQCQIVILTCYPGRYAHVGNATVVNL